MKMQLIVFAVGVGLLSSGYATTDCSSYFADLNDGSTTSQINTAVANCKADTSCEVKQISESSENSWEGCKQGTAFNQESNVTWSTGCIECTSKD